MTRRLYLGNTGGGGLRISKPGYDVITEAYGSRNIAFDSRLSYLGNVLAAGLIQCGGSQITFGPLSYIPLVQIKLWDGTNLSLTDFANKDPDSGTSWSILNGGYLHAFIPAVGIVTASTFKVVQYTNPFYDTTAFYNANGLYYFYTVYAIG